MNRVIELNKILFESTKPELNENYDAAQRILRFIKNFIR